MQKFENLIVHDSFSPNAFQLVVKDGLNWMPWIYYWTMAILRVGHENAKIVITRYIVVHGNIAPPDYRNDSICI